MLKLKAHQREELSRSFSWVAFATSGFLFITYQVVTAGWLITIDDKIATFDRYLFPDWVYFILRRIDDLGLRGISAVAILLLSAYLWRRFNTYRPILLSVVALLALNGVVGVFKLAIGRTKPRLNMDILNFGGMSFPSGHISNAVLIWGLFAYLIYRYLWSEPECKVFNYDCVICNDCDYVCLAISKHTLVLRLTWWDFPRGSTLDRSNRS